MSLRLGEIKFLNSWPVTYALRRGLIGNSGIVSVSGSPAELNRRLLAGELDASAVSSLLYLRHPEEMVPVPGLCIRADKAVASVLVVSRRPVEELKGKTIGVSNQGATTPVLLKILLAKRNLKMNLQVTPLRYPEILDEYPAALLIGDEALAARQDTSFLTWDLGEGWAARMKLPFVFALWVVRRNSLKEDPEILENLSQTLLSSYGWGRSHSKELLAAMRKVFPWENSFLYDYLSKLSYDLDEEAWKGLSRFAREAQDLGEIPQGSTKRLGILDKSEIHLVNSR